MNKYRIPNAEVAQILEDAADLYESEQIEWCTGQWARSTPGVKKVSACAEGAILLACGYKWTSVFGHGTMLFDTDIRAKAAHDALLDVVREVSGYHTVYGWNDHAIGSRELINQDGLVVMGPPNASVAKAEVVEAMKEAAKGLRNE